ncbi:OsmC/Ohr family protein [Pseudomonas syringae pv. tomato T1]|nr:OsmC/Ohr family protein [Pseudomonas syringae pv. tomato T1]
MAKWHTCRYRLRMHSRQLFEAVRVLFANVPTRFLQKAFFSRPQTPFGAVLS